MCCLNGTTVPLRGKGSETKDPRDTRDPSPPHHRNRVPEDQAKAKANAKAKAKDKAKDKDKDIKIKIKRLLPVGSHAGVGGFIWIDVNIYLLYGIQFNILDNSIQLDDSIQFGDPIQLDDSIASVNLQSHCDGEPL